MPDARESMALYYVSDQRSGILNTKMSPDNIKAEFYEIIIYIFRNSVLRFVRISLTVEFSVFIHAF